MLQKSKQTVNIATMHTQARTVIDRFGGVALVAKLVGRRPSTVYRWLYPREKGGTGGLIPAPDMARIIRAADLLGVELTPYEVNPLRRDL